MRQMLAAGWLGVGLFMAGIGGVGAQSLKGGAAAPLEKTRWTLEWVDGVKVQGGSPRPAFLELDPGTHRLRGSGGCNQLIGSYELEGNHLRLTGTARTMMACRDGMDVEDRLVKALDEVREWKVSGQELVLLDGKGDVLARFETGRSD